MKTNHNQKTTTADIYAYAEKCTGVALRARHEKSGLQLLADLQNQSRADQTARSAPQTAEREAEHRKAWAEARAEADTMRAYANRLTISEAERKSAYRTAREATNRAERERATADSLLAELDRTMSDRADLVQSALLALVELTRTNRALHSALAIAKLTEDSEALEAIRAEVFRHCTNSAGKAINQTAHPEALNRTTTQATRATPEEVTAWINLYGDTGKAVKIAIPHKRTRASDCFDTMEFKTYKDPSKTGFYRVRHWVTVAPYQSIDQLNENGDTIGYFKSYDPFTSDQGTAERLEALATSAQLTDRERQFIAHFTSTTASTKGAEARAHSTATTAEARANAEYKAMIDYAFGRIGITSTENRKKFMQRLKNRLAQSVPERTERTAEERAEADRKAWAKLQANRTRGHHTATADRTDLLTWTDSAQRTTAEPQAIAWLTEAQAEGREADRAQAIRRAHEESTIDNSTRSARARAREAEKRYRAKQEAEAKRRAEAKAKAEAEARAKEEAQRAREEEERNAKARTNRITAKQWNNWTPDQRLAHINHVLSMGQRTEFITE